MDGLMDQISNNSRFEREAVGSPDRRSTWRVWRVAAAGVALAVIAAFAHLGFSHHNEARAVAPQAALPLVTVSKPSQRAGRHAAWISRAIFCGRQNRTASSGWRCSDGDPLQGWPDCPQGRSSFRHRPAPLRDQACAGKRPTADCDGTCCVREQPAFARTIASAQRVRDPGDGRPTYVRPGRVSGCGRGRQGAHTRCRA
jgi:hypothetical protein